MTVTANRSTTALGLFDAPYNPFDDLPTVGSPTPEMPIFGRPTDAPDQRVTSGYGLRTRPTRGASTFHQAYDIGGPTGGVINANNATAASNGKVISAGWSGGYGNKVVVDHGNGYRTHYAHLDSLAVEPGDEVFMGDALGSVGNTGTGTGAHLDFAVYKDGRKVDPGSVGYGIGAGQRPNLEVPAALGQSQIDNVQDYARSKGQAAPVPSVPVPTPNPLAQRGDDTRVVHSSLEKRQNALRDGNLTSGVRRDDRGAPYGSSSMAVAATPTATPAIGAIEAMTQASTMPETPSIPVMEPPTAPVPTAKPEPMTVTQQDVLDAFNRQNGTPMPGAPVPMSKPSTGAPMPTPNPMALADRTPPTPSPNPMAMADRTPPIPTANPLGQAPQTQVAFAGNNSPSVPTAAPPGGITNEPGFIQGLAPSLVERAKELGLEAPEGQVIGYSPVAPNGLTSVNANAGPSATGPGLFGFSERDFGIGGGGAQGLASYATGMPGRIGGSVLGGAAGTAVGGPIGGILGAMLGGYAGGKITSGLAAQNAASALGQAPVNTGGWLGGLFGGDPSSSSEISQESRDAVSGKGGLW